MIRLKVEEDIRVLTSLNELDKVLKDNSDEHIVAFDTESDIKVEPHKTTLISFRFRASPTYLIPHYLIDIADAVDMFKQKELKLLGANITYDTNMIGWDKQFEDVQWLARITHPHIKAFALDSLYEYILKFNPYKALSADKKAMQKSFISDIEFSDEQLYYSALDVHYMFDLYLEILRRPIAYDIVYDMATNKNHIYCTAQTALEVPAYKLDKRVALIAQEMQKNGIYIDVKKAKEELNKLDKIIEEQEAELWGYVPGINVRSYKQVRAALNSDDSSKPYLISVINARAGLKARIAELILSLRSKKKLKNLLESYQTEHCYTRFNVNGATTSRFTSSGEGLVNGINAQQIPRQYQYIMQQNTEDTIAIHADYSTAELRAAASLMPDKQMASYIFQGIDLHKVSATMATGGTIAEVDKEARQKGKAISFGFVFGMSAKSFMEYAYLNYGVKFTAEQSKSIRDNYMTTYRGVANYAKYWWENYKKRAATSPLGHKVMPKLGTDAINYRVQSAIAEVTKIAVVNMDKKGFTPYMFNVVHDAIDSRIPKTIDVEEYVQAKAEAMLLAWYETQADYNSYLIKNIPMVVELAYNLDGVDCVREFTLSENWQVQEL